MVKQEQFNQEGGGAHRGNCCGIGLWQDIQKVKKSHTNYKYPTFTTTSSKSTDTMKCRQDWNNEIKTITNRQPSQTKLN